MADNDVPTIEIDGEEYRLPFVDVLAQTVDDESLIHSIQQEGMIYPIVYRETDEGKEIIDGNTRAQLVAAGKVDPDDAQFEKVDVEDDDHAYDLAIQLNFQRRQISPVYRRKTIEKIKSEKNWRKLNAHVKDLAELLGVSKATISKDIAKIEGGDKVEELRETRTRINYILTGFRYMDSGEVTKPDLSDEFDDDEIEVGQRYVEALQNELEVQRDEINKQLKKEREEAA